MIELWWQLVRWHRKNWCSWPLMARTPYWSRALVQGTPSKLKGWAEASTKQESSAQGLKLGSSSIHQCSIVKTERSSDQEKTPLRWKKNLADAQNQSHSWTQAPLHKPQRPREEKLRGMQAKCPTQLGRVRANQRWSEKARMPLTASALIQGTKEEHQWT